MIVDHIKGHILLIEDDVSIGDLTKSILERLSFDCTLVQSLKEGVDLLQQNTYNVIICDYYLSDATAREMIELIDNENIKTPLIIATGDCDIEIEESRTRRIIRKPFRSKTLTQIIEEILS